MLQHLRLLVRPTSAVPDEIRQLQLALAVCLADVAIADDRWLYKTSLAMARKLHDLGGRMPECRSS